LFIREFTTETLCEYFGENLVLFIKRGEKAKNIMDMMTSVVFTMKRLHELNISHGDLKAENMVTKDGIVKLIDFGPSREFFNTSQLDSSIIE